MKKYRFYIYRDTFFPDGLTPEVPDERVIETDDPRATAQSLCKGEISCVEWDLEEVKT